MTRRKVSAAPTAPQKPLPKLPPIVAALSAESRQRGRSFGLAARVARIGGSKSWDDLGAP